METIIIICLIIIIVLQLQDKMVIQRTKGGVPEPPQKKESEHGIMGIPRVVEKPETTMNVVAKSLKERELGTPDFENTAREKEQETLFPEELPESIADELPDSAQQWDSYEYPDVRDDFSNGVTYDQISTVVQVLRQPNLPEPSLQQETVKIVQKMEYTELFSLLEGGIEGASQKIAELLDQNLYQTKPSTIYKKKNDLRDFDIEEFI